MQRIGRGVYQSLERDAVIWVRAKSRSNNIFQISPSLHEAYQPLQVVANAAMSYTEPRLSWFLNKDGVKWRLEHNKK